MTLMTKFKLQAQWSDRLGHHGSMHGRSINLSLHHRVRTGSGAHGTGAHWPYFTSITKFRPMH